MTEYRVTLTGESREVYVVEADSPEAAARQWVVSGSLVLSESYGMGIDSVEVDDE